MCANTYAKVILSFDYAMCAHTFYNEDNLTILYLVCCICKIFLNML
jgi:hypothetical protein